MPGGSPACRRQIVRNSKLEALSQILPLPAMTGRGIVALYDLFDRIEQFPVILKNANYLGTPPVTAYRSTAQSKGIS